MVTRTRISGTFICTLPVLLGFGAAVWLIFPFSVMTPQLWRDVITQKKKYIIFYSASPTPFACFCTWLNCDDWYWFQGIYFCWIMIGTRFRDLLLLNCGDLYLVQGIYCCWIPMIGTRFRGFIVAESWWLVLGSGIYCCWTVVIDTRFRGFIVAESWWLVLGSGIYCCWTVVIGTRFRGFIIAESWWLVLGSGVLLLLNCGDW